MNEIVAVPGRVENDNIETEAVFVREAGRLIRSRGMPPRADRYEQAGIDVHGLLNGSR